MLLFFSLYVIIYASRGILLIIMKWQVNTMKFKKLAAAVIAAATAIIPLSSDISAALPSSTVYAAEHATGAALPEWIPQSFESALDFRSTYGATHVQDGLVCIVFREQYEKVPEGEPQGVLRYDIRTTKDMMMELFHKTYADENSRDCYEVVVYYAPQKQGNFEVALVDTWLKSSELDLGYNHAIAHYSFSIGEGNEITETDIYSWLPDSYAEFYDYAEKNGYVSAKDEFVVFCINDTAGIRYKWEETSDGYSDYFQRYTSSYCSRETAQPLAGGQTPHVEVYKAVKDGKALIKWSFVPSDDDLKLQSTKNLTAYATASDNASKVTLSDEIVNNAEFSYNNYSLYDTELKATGEDAYFAFDRSKSAVIKSKSELSEFLDFYLNDDAIKKFVSQYSDKFFENNVLILNTYLDKYRGRVSRFGLESVYSRDNTLYVDYTPIISGTQSRTSYLSILQLTMPKDAYKYNGAEWECRETFSDNVKRITFIDEDTNKFVNMDNIDLSKLFGIEMKNLEGQNPYYWEVITAEWLDLNIDEKYLPSGYELSKEKPREVINNGNNTGDITFRLRKKETVGVKYSINKYSTITKNLFADLYTMINDFKPTAVKSQSELKEITSKYFSEEYQEKIFGAYDEAFFKNNVLLFDLCFDSTGGDMFSVDDTVFSDDDITVYYTQPAPDFGICNTDFLFVVKVIVPKSEYSGQNAVFKCTGDANGDGDFGIADLVTLQKWLHSGTDTKLDDWRAVDLCKDDVIDIFDLVAMRKKLIATAKLPVPKQYPINVQHKRCYCTPSYDREGSISFLTSAEEVGTLLNSQGEPYDDEWFDTHKIMVITFTESSGSIRHEVTELTDQYVTINRLLTQVMTCDMAEWNIYLELDKDAVIRDDFKINWIEVQKLY